MRVFLHNASSGLASLRVLVLAGLVATVLSACGGGASTETNPDTGGSTTVGASTYNGPNAQTDDIRAFQVNVWEPLRVSSRCGACHNEEVGQVPMFVRSDDVNQAYSAANPLINLDAPSASRLVQKVGGGHNCWLSSAAACAQRITSFIEAWASGGSSGGRQIQLTAPTPKQPGASRRFPDDNGALFAASALRTTLIDNCQRCHSEAAETPQAPFFASEDLALAYEAVKSKIDLSDDANDPRRSRLIVRLRDEFHNCWGSPVSCPDSAATMQGDILDFIAAIDAANPPTGVDPALVISNALNLADDGIIASGGNRYEANVIALYEFKTGSGNIALDTSNVAPDLNLTLSGDYEWVGGWGIRFNSGAAKAQGSTVASKKLHDLITATGEYSIEAWVAPANVTQEGPARIVSYSGGVNARNFTLGQTKYNYDFMQRSSTADANGEPALSTADADEDLQASLQHVVLTFDPINGRRIYVNGVFTDDMDPVTPGNLNDWDDGFALVLGNEVSGNRLWKGAVRMLAIHNRALTPEQIRQNFEVGVGQKFFLLFGIGDVAGVPAGSYIMFEVAQYDSYSYLFKQPTFINLDPSVTPGGIALKGMRIGLNGREVAVGQAYKNLDLTIGSNYDPAKGEVLSRIGTIIALENGQDRDEFFLTFEQLGDESHAFVEPAGAPLPPPPETVVASDIGVRTFDEINATMAALTGVDPQTTAVRNTFNTVRQQLPSVETIEGFLSAHQMGIAQLSIAYCDALVEDATARSAFFANALANGFSFDTDVYSAFGGSREVDIADDIYDRMMGLPSVSAPDLGDAPTRVEVQAELNGAGGLYERLRGATCPDPGPAPDMNECTAVRTRAIVKAMCAAALGSAAMLVQ
ncbi:MAG TPA: LamG domain-containing protein [Gammaproteobacteria bacterium]|nr:LamG domain-containing protein [Gammaproteobacteria bacterium]